MLGLDTQFQKLACARISGNHTPRNPIKYATREILEKKNHPFPHILLQTSNIQSQQIDLQYIDSTPFFFKTKAEGATQHDILAAAFYLLSRYEEYLPFEADEHGRFPAHQSLAYKTGFLQRPIIQEWSVFFADHLKSLFPKLQIQPPSYTMIWKINSSRQINNGNYQLE